MVLYDDDFHFPQRIENSVKRLQKLGSRFVAGNSKMLICDIYSGNVYSTGPFHKNHCTCQKKVFRFLYLLESLLLRSLTFLYNLFSFAEKNIKKKNAM